MLRFLFPRLTKQPPRGQAVFDLVVNEARKPAWYSHGGVPDTLDGRFAMLTTICALVTVRLELSPDGNLASAALTERFIEAMDAEHRQLGMNDPTLGKRVRKMVASLSRRVGDWRGAIAGGDWAATTRSSVFRDAEVPTNQLGFTADKLRALWERLDTTNDADLLEGRLK
jgi:cytochrome b pre-mRNA-processing protein 3